MMNVVQKEGKKKQCTQKHCAEAISHNAAQLAALQEELNNTHALLASVVPGLSRYKPVPVNGRHKAHAAKVKAGRLHDKTVTCTEDGYAELPPAYACLLKGEFVLAHLDPTYFPDITGTSHVWHLVLLVLLSCYRM